MGKCFNNFLSRFNGYAIKVISSESNSLIELLESKRSTLTTLSKIKRDNDWLRIQRRCEDMDKTHHILEGKLHLYIIKELVILNTPSQTYVT